MLSEHLKIQFKLLSLMPAKNSAILGTRRALSNKTDLRTLISIPIFSITSPYPKILFSLGLEISFHPKTRSGLITWAATGSHLSALDLISPAFLFQRHSLLALHCTPAVKSGVCGTSSGTAAQAVHSMGCHSGKELCAIQLPGRTERAHWGARGGGKAGFASKEKCGDAWVAQQLSICLQLRA